MSYSILDHHSGCRVIYGMVPLDDYVTLIDSWAKNDEENELLLCAKLAEAVKANTVVGTVAQINAMRKEHYIKPMPE